MKPSPAIANRLADTRSLPLFALLAACGGSVASGNAPGTTGAGTATGGGTGATTSTAVTTNGSTGATTSVASSGSTTGGPTCNAAVNDAPWVATLPDPGIAPLPAGGVIASGRYVETSDTAFTNGGTCKPTTTRSRWVGEITAASAASGTIHEAFTIEGLGDGTGNVTYQTAGSTMTNTVDCFTASWGGAGSATIQNFTATANEILTFGNSGTCTAISVLTRQP